MDGERRQYSRRAGPFDGSWSVSSLPRACRITDLSPGGCYIVDLSKDPSEKKDLAAERPEIVEQMKQELTKWEAEMKAPLWLCRTPGGNFEVDGIKLNICV